MSQSPTVAELALQAARYPQATRIVQATPWTALPLVAPWAAAGSPPEYRVDSAGNVAVRGSVAGGPPAGVVANLPVTLAPLAAHSWPIVSLTAPPAFQLAWISVDPAGNLILVASTVGPAAELRLDGIAYNLF